VIAAGKMAHTGWLYYGGILIAAGLLSIYQQKLIFSPGKALCFKAFLNNKGTVWLYFPG